MFKIEMGKMFFWCLLFTIGIQDWSPVVSAGAPPAAAGSACKFGKPIPGSCKCGPESKPICGSDLEDYKNKCEFKCALDCNPSLVSFTGPCAEGGIKLKKPLNFAAYEDDMNDEDLAALSEHSGVTPPSD